MPQRVLLVVLNTVALMLAVRYLSLPEGAAFGGTVGSFAAVFLSWRRHRREMDADL